MNRDPRDYLPHALIAAFCFLGVAIVVLISALSKAALACT